MRNNMVYDTDKRANNGSGKKAKGKSRKGRYMLFLLLVLPMFTLSCFAPKLIEGYITTVEATAISQAYYTEDILTDGYIEAQGAKDIIAEIPYVPERVYFKIGDTVKANDVIADIDVSATQAALFNMVEAVNVIPDEYKNLVSGISVSQDLIKGYIPTSIKAPADGVITAMTLTEGAIATPKSAVATISKTNKLRACMSVKESDADKLKTGDTVVFKANATSDKKYVGKIQLIAPAAVKTLVGTSQSTIVNFYVSIEGSYSDRLRPGYTVTGVVKQPNDEPVNILPYEAIMQDDNNQEYVYLIHGSRLQRCNVKTGRELSNGIEIVSPSLAAQKIVKDVSAVKDENCLVRAITN